jgi:putative Mg2+ transporter-C (MgtC) family protein
MENIALDFEIGIRLLVSFAIGAAIGFERQYQSKVAGLRTMIIICLGSTIFTEISLAIGGDSQDRIASNIITGIGFLGAGVIFKDGLTISGITTATTIWISAALGMAVGAGEYFIALTGCAIMLLVLSALQPITRAIDRWHEVRSYRIRYSNNDTFMAQLEKHISSLGLRSSLKKDFKDKDGYIVIYEVTGKEKRLTELNRILKEEASVVDFEY